MSNFFVGTLVGFFLGALVMFVGLGIICLYLVERGEQTPRAGPRTARETRDDPRGAILFPNQEPPDTSRSRPWRNRGPS